MLHPAQFTELQQKEQLAKLAMARTDLATAPSARKFKFVSNVNEQVSLLRCCLNHPESHSKSCLLLLKERLMSRAGKLHVAQRCDLM